MELVLMGYKTYKSTPKFIGDQQVTNAIKADFVETNLLKIDGLIINRTVVSSSYSIKRNEYFIGVHTENAACSITLTLPNASGSVNGRTYIIKDEGGMADTYPIVINTLNGDIVDGEDTFTIDSPYASLNLYTDGFHKWFIY
jgi:hypothetical protein